MQTHVDAMFAASVSVKSNVPFLVGLEVLVFLLPSVPHFRLLLLQPIARFLLHTHGRLPEASLVGESLSSPCPCFL